jgi:hypothetical protein
MPNALPIRRTLLLGAVGVGVAAGALTARTGLGWAADDGGVLEFLRSEAARIAPPSSTPTPRGFAAVAPARRGFGEVAAPARFVSLRPSSGTTATAAEPARTICVRTCDGFAFPLGRLASRADLPAHQEGCAAACPGAPTALYTLPAGQADPTRATSLSGQPYARLATAGLHKQRAVPNCACNGPKIPHTPIVRDPTLRAGDVVAGRLGASAVVGDEAGRRRFVEFRRPGALSAPVRREVDRLTGTTRREVAEAQFRRDLRVRHAAMVAARGEAPRVRLASAGGFAVLAAGTGFTPVRVVVPSPYVAR